MSGLFEPVKLQWRGQEYVIPANRVLKAIAVVEDVVTLEQLSSGARAPMAKIAEAFGALLRFAGAPNVQDEDVYLSLFRDGGDNVILTAAKLTTLMLPPKVQESLAEQMARTQAEAAQVQGGMEGNGGLQKAEGS